MGKAPAFQMYAGDRLTELTGLDNEAVGAWTRAMLFLWANDGPAPTERVALAAGKGWDRVCFLFAHENGTTSLEWMEKTREKQRQYRELQAANGSKGGRPRRRKKGSLRVAEGLPKAEQRVGSMKNEDEDEVEIEGKGVRGKPERKGPDPNVQAVIDHLTTRLREEGISQSLDGAQTRNRFSASNLLRKLAKDYPNFDPVLSARSLIDAALKDPFHRTNTTSVAYLFNNCGKIAASARARSPEAKNQSDATRKREIIAELDRRFDNIK